MMDWLNNLSDTQQFALFTGVKILAAFAILMTMVAYIVLVERRVCAFVQDRVGPNRVGPFGLLQPAADGIKAFLKEEFTPAHVRKMYFFLAPGIALMPAILNLAVIPFGSKIGNQPMVLANLNVGILYTFGIVSLGVYSIVLAGYAANSKYPFLGGIRSSAQMISYEISMGLSVIPVFLLAGSLNLSDVISYQAHGLFTGWCSSSRWRSRFSSARPLPKPTARRLICRRPSRNWPAATTSNTAPSSLRCFSWANTRT